MIINKDGNCALFHENLLPHYQKFALYQRNYWQNNSVGNLGSPLPTDFTPSVILSVTTDGQHPSVYTDEITNEMLRIFLKKDGSLTWRLLGVFFTGGFKTSAPYGDVTDSPMEMPTDSPRDSKCQSRMVTRPIHWWNCRQNNRQIQNDSTVRWRALFADRLADGVIDGNIH
jgi:hypothetical protein